MGAPAFLPEPTSVFGKLHVLNQTDMRSAMTEPKNRGFALHPCNTEWAGF